MPRSPSLEAMLERQKESEKQGLADLFSARKETRERQRPEAVLGQQVLQAIQALAQAPQRSEDIEGRAAQGEFGATPDLNRLFEQLQPETAEAENLLNVISKFGITPSSTGVALKASQFVPQTVFNPETGEYIEVGQVPRGTVTRNIRPTLEQESDRSGARAAGAEVGRGMSPEKASAYESAGSVIRSIDNLTRLLDKDETLFNKATLPGSRVSPDEIVKEAVFWIDNIKTQSQFAKGGKVLTIAELKAVNKTLTSLVRGEKVSRIALEELRTTISNIRTRLAGETQKYSKQEDSASNKFIEDMESKGFEYLGVEE